MNGLTFSARVTWESATLRSVLFLNPCGMWWTASTPLCRFFAWLVVNWEKYSEFQAWHDRDGEICCILFDTDFVPKKSMQIARSWGLCFVPSWICWPCFQRFHGIRYKSAHCAKHVLYEVTPKRLHTTSFRQHDATRTNLAKTHPAAL